jgi:hypothetical protein
MTDSQLRELAERADFEPAADRPVDGFFTAHDIDGPLWYFVRSKDGEKIAAPREELCGFIAACSPSAILALLDRVRDAEGRAAAVCCKGEPHTCDQEAIAACRLLGPLHRAARGGGVDGDVVHLSRLRTDRSEGGDAELSDVRQQ